LRSVQEPDLVTAPALSAARSRRIRLPLWWVVLLAAAVIGTLALIHLPATHPRAAAAPVNPDTPIHGQTLQQARCSDWLVATAAEKQAAVTALTAIVGGPTEYRGVRGTTLTRPEAYQLMTNACSSRIARNFLLYELYIRAAAFRSLAVAEP
jgi:hypothetical protein